MSEFVARFRYEEQLYAEYVLRFFELCNVMSIESNELERRLQRIPILFYNYFEMHSASIDLEFFTKFFLRKFLCKFDVTFFIDVLNRVFSNDNIFRKNVLKIIEREKIRSLKIVSDIFIACKAQDSDENDWPRVLLSIEQSDIIVWRFAAAETFNFMDVNLEHFAVKSMIDNVFPSENAFKIAILSEIYKKEDKYCKANENFWNNNWRAVDSIEDLKLIIERFSDFFFEELGVAAQRVDWPLAMRNFFVSVGEKFSCFTLLDIVKKMPNVENNFVEFANAHIKKKIIEYFSIIDFIFSGANYSKNSEEKMLFLFRKLPELPVEFFRILNVPFEEVDWQLVAEIVLCFCKIKECDMKYVYELLTRSGNISVDSNVFVNKILFELEKQENKYWVDISDALRDVTTVFECGEFYSDKKIFDTLLDIFSTIYVKIWSITCNMIYFQKIEKEIFLLIKQNRRDIHVRNVINCIEMDKVAKEIFAIIKGMKIEHSAFFLNFLAGKKNSCSDHEAIEKFAISFLAFFDVKKPFFSGQALDDFRRFFDGGYVLLYVCACFNNVFASFSVSQKVENSSGEYHQFLADTWQKHQEERFRHSLELSAEGCKNCKDCEFLDKVVPSCKNDDKSAPLALCDKPL